MNVRDKRTTVISLLPAQTHVVHTPAHATRDTLEMGLNAIIMLVRLLSFDTVELCLTRNYKQHMKM